MLLDMFSNYETIGDKECRHPQVFPTIVNNTQTVLSAILATLTSTSNVVDLDSFPCSNAVGLELLI